MQTLLGHCRKRGDKAPPVFTASLAALLSKNITANRIAALRIAANVAKLLRAFDRWHDLDQR
jgi:hypothetical protein